MTNFIKKMKLKDKLKKLKKNLQNLINKKFIKILRKNVENYNHIELLKYNFISDKTATNIDARKQFRLRKLEAINRYSKLRIIAKKLKKNAQSCGFADYMSTA